MDLQKLRDQGWYLTEDGIKKLLGDVDRVDAKKVIQAAMDTDFREIADGALPAEILRKDESIPGKRVLQITRIRNISAPKSNEESKAAPRFLQIDFTDGVNQAVGLEFEHISALNLNVPPGTKIYFKNETIQVMSGFLVLGPNNIQVLGGKVSALIEKWEISRTLQKYARGGRMLTGSSGPPPWIPFGQKIQQNIGGDKNFKSLGAEKEKESKENEFDVMRNEAIAEAAKAGGRKVFGGGNQPILDYNVKRILEKGYSEDDAKNALQKTRNNLERALNNLKRRDDVKDDSRDKTRRVAKDSKKDPPAPKPMGNVSLFDFLTDKLPMPTDGAEKLQQMKSDRNSKCSSEPPKAVNNSTMYNHSQSRESQYQSHHTCGNSTNFSKPKFENNISSSFANRNASSSAKDNEKINRSRNPRINSGSNNYPNRQHEFGDKPSKDFQRSGSSFIKNPKQSDRSNNHQNGPINVGTFEGRNRNDYQQKNGYDKYGKGHNASRYPPKGESTYQSNSRNYNDNRSSTYNNNDSTHINKLTEETSKLNIDNKNRSTGSVSASRSGLIVGASMQYHQSQQKPSQPPSHHQQQQSKHIMPHTTYAQLPNGFTYDPSKIVGFQSKEANDFAMSLMKNQAIATSIPAQQPVTVTPYPQSMPIPQTFPAAPFVMQQPAHAPPPQAFAMNPSDSWNWKVGDRCFAKYWDDGRYYEAEITAVSDRTCVVFFLGYGNHEEVLRSDCHPSTDAQNRPINFPKLHEVHNQQSAPPSQVQNNLNRGMSNRYRGERQMYVPPPKRET